MFTTYVLVEKKQNEFLTALSKEASLLWRPVILMFCADYMHLIERAHTLFLLRN